MASDPSLLVRGVYKGAGFRFDQLPRTRAEVRSIATLFPAADTTLRLGLEASESTLKSEALREYRRVHFATHAVLDERTPARSGIVLSLVGSGQEDGILRVNEVFDLKLNAELVVLSACQTGLGVLVRGEGMVGVTRAFLSAGASRVVVSLWEVNDQATSSLMNGFYRHLASNQSPTSALRAAKLAMLHSGQLAYRHPYFWAPFVLTGAQ